MCYSSNIRYLFFEIKNFCLLQCILMGSDSSLAILKPTVKRDQIASVFTKTFSGLYFYFLRKLRFFFDI